MTGEDDQGPLVFIITGEPSGDLLGARLMKALKAETDGKIRFAGIGGDAMQAEGLDSLVDLKELAVMGLLEVLPKAPTILKRVKQTIAEIKRQQPDVLVTIDSWGFTMRINKVVRKFTKPIRQVHYVAPMVWVWREKRVHQLAEWVDELMALLPHEPACFDGTGLKVTCVGHPVVESGADKGDGPGFRARHGIPAEATVLGVLPGSRRSETSRMLPIFKDVVAKASAANENLHLIVPTVSTVAKEVEAEVTSWGLPVTFVSEVSERYDSMAAMDTALATSGTVTLELGMAGVPAVICYRVSALSAWLFRRVADDPVASLLNRIMDRYVVPEFLQERCEADLIAPALIELMQDEDIRQAQRDGLHEALVKMGLGKDTPSANAAHIVLAAAGRK